jgi:hypothetical protein
MEEIGRPLDEVMTVFAFEQAVRCLGELQTGSLDQIDTLLPCGCFDQRLPILRANLPELIRYLEDAMTRQASIRVPPIESRRLDELGGLLAEACDCIEALGIPDALIHNDMNSGNILFDGSRAVFTDWAEASVGNPFFTFHHLCAHALLKDPAHASAEHLTNTYKQHWCGLLAESDMDRGLALTPPLAIVSYLCGRDPLFVSEYRRNAHCESYARSLARHIDRAVQAPEFMEALCQ